MCLPPSPIDGGSITNIKKRRDCFDKGKEKNDAGTEE